LSFSSSRRDHDDGNIIPFVAQQTAHFEAVYKRQHYIEKYQVGVFAFRKLQPFVPS
jgi:hypothetical protein